MDERLSHLSERFSGSEDFYRIAAALEEAYQLADQAWLARVHGWIKQLEGFADNQIETGETLGDESARQVYIHASEFLGRELAAINNKTPDQ